MRAIEYADGVIRAIDQTALPEQERWLTITTTAQLAKAIKRLAIRGAPMLGIAGAYGVAQAADTLAKARKAGATLKATRPTAMNLGWAIDRMLELAQRTPKDQLRKTLETEAHAIADEDEAACLAMAEAGQVFLLGDKPRVLTHCNTGFLCTGGYGTALGVIRLAHERGKDISVLAGETRPLLQGARLTAWELARFGIPHELIPDSAGAGLIQRGEADVVIVGADRIAANGDVANKVGTYPLALAAHASGIPFVVVAPISTIDMSIDSGAQIEVEQRHADEVTRIGGTYAAAPEGTRARNPAFDITPARYITAIVTERGIAQPPDRDGIARLVRRT